ncbi:MAG: trigger factor [Clostridia bacterium]|nr:trigger factor [Clostridia bacterium]
MKYTFEKAEKSTVKITIELNEQEWNESISKAYEQTKSRYSLPGFRKGKVPKHLIESTYGKGVFFEDAINIAFPKYYEEVLNKEPSIFAISQPEIDVKDLSDKGITLLAIVPVKPEVTLGDYKGIKFTKKEYKVKKADVDEDVKRLQERNSRLVDITDRESQDGDTVTIDFSGSIDGVKFEGGTAEKQTLVIGAKQYIPGFEEQVIGMKIGEERDINVKFPKDYGAAELADKDAVFAIKLHEIKKKELPELNDDFIKESTGVATLEEYKKETKARLQKQNDDRADREIEDEIINKITENATMEIPDALIENQIDRMVQEMEYRMSYQGLKLADHLKYLNKTMEEYRGEFKEQAEKTVRSQLVIDKVLEVEKIEATDDEVEERVKEMAEKQGKKVPDVKKNINARQLDYIKNEIIIKKLFEFLKANNVIEKEGKTAEAE